MTTAGSNAPVLHHSVVQVSLQTRARKGKDCDRWELTYNAAGEDKSNFLVLMDLTDELTFAPWICLQIHFYSVTDF